MDSLWEGLVGVLGSEHGRAAGDATLLDALFRAVEDGLADSPLRPAVIVGGCQGDPSSVTGERAERLAGASAALSLLACSPACGPVPEPGPEVRFDTVVIPTLHQANRGPLLVAVDRRAAFGVVIAARRRDVPQPAEGAAIYDVVWSLSAEAASTLMHQLGPQLQELGAEVLPQAAAAAEAPAPARQRHRPRAKPGASGRGAADDALAGRETTLSVAGRLLEQLQTAAALEGALISLAARLGAAREIDDALEILAAVVGRALDASRVTALHIISGATDELPTMRLEGTGPFNEVREGVYTRVDTRRLDSARMERTDTGSVVSRLVLPILRGGGTIGEIRLLDTRPSRVWTAMERRFVERAGAVAAEALSRPFAAAEPESGAATTDKLTGLEHRSAFNRRLRAAVDEAERAGEPVSLVRLKIDRLEDINETYGYSVGDAVIRHVAGMLRERLAEDEGSSLARFGGEGFAILLPGFTRTAALRVADILVDAVKASRVPPVGEIAARAGVATFPECASGADQLAAVARSRMVAG
jgi:diguanylate cyclase (GGDEF)-like protein